MQVVGSRSEGDRPGLDDSSGGDHVPGFPQCGSELGGATGEDQLVVIAERPVQCGNYAGAGSLRKLIHAIQYGQNLAAAGHVGTKLCGAQGGIVLFQALRQPVVQPRVGLGVPARYRQQQNRLPVLTGGEEFQQQLHRQGCLAGTRPAQDDEAPSAESAESSGPCWVALRESHLRRGGAAARSTRPGSSVPAGRCCPGRGCSQTNASALAGSHCSAPVPLRRTRTS